MLKKLAWLKEIRSQLGTFLKGDLISMNFLKEDIIEKLETKSDSRPSWDQIWIHFAETISLRSYDANTRVGAVIVTEDNTQVLSMGYNGNYSGGPNRRDSETPGHSGFIHAEINALIKLDFNNPKKKKLYLTTSPCKSCAKAIINAGISEVVYKEEYRLTEGIELLKSVGIPCRQFEP